MPLAACHGTHQLNDLVLNGLHHLSLRAVDKAHATLELRGNLKLRCVSTCLTPLSLSTLYRSKSLFTCNTFFLPPILVFKPRICLDFSPASIASVFIFLRAAVPSALFLSDSASLFHSISDYFCLFLTPRRVRGGSCSHGCSLPPAYTTRARTSRPWYAKLFSDMR